MIVTTIITTITITITIISEDHHASPTAATQTFLVTSGCSCLLYRFNQTSCLPRQIEPATWSDLIDSKHDISKRGSRIPKSLPVFVEKCCSKRVGRT